MSIHLHATMMFFLSMYLMDSYLFVRLHSNTCTQTFTAKEDRHTHWRHWLRKMQIWMGIRNTCFCSLLIFILICTNNCKNKQKYYLHSTYFIVLNVILNNRGHFCGINVFFVSFLKNTLKNVRNVENNTISPVSFKNTTKNKKHK